MGKGPRLHRRALRKRKEVYTELWDLTLELWG